MYEDRNAVSGISGTPVKPKFPDEVRALLEERASSARRATENFRDPYTPRQASAQFHTLGRPISPIESSRSGWTYQNQPEGSKLNERDITFSCPSNKRTTAQRQRCGVSGATGAKSTRQVLGNGARTNNLITRQWDPMFLLMDCLGPASGAGRKEGGADIVGAHL